MDDRNPDLENLLGYAYRNVGRLDEAFRHCRQALRLNPRHRGAHEYIGEAYLLINDLGKAEEHLATLARICVVPCGTRRPEKKDRGIQAVALIY